MWPTRLLVLFVALAPRLASPTCVAQGRGILWSFPADGATGVPTNVDVWLVPEPYWTTTVSLDGVPLSPAGTTGGERFHWEGAPPLEPNTTYSLTVTQQRSPSDVSTFTRTFTTGDGPLAESAVEVSVTSVTLRSLGQYGGEEWLAESDFCRGVTMAQGCHDFGRMAQLSLDSPTEATFWASEDPGYWERGSVWPGECGRPAMVHGASTAEEVCGTWRPIDAAGHPMGSVTTCVALPANFTGELVESSPSDGPGAPEAVDQGAEVGERTGGGDASAPSDGAAQATGACQAAQRSGPPALATLLALLCGLLGRLRRSRYVAGDVTQ